MKSITPEDVLYYLQLAGYTEQDVFGKDNLCETSQGKEILNVVYFQLTQHTPSRHFSSLNEFVEEANTTIRKVRERKQRLALLSLKKLEKQHEH